MSRDSERRTRAPIDAALRSLKFHTRTGSLNSDIVDDEVRADRSNSRSKHASAYAGPNSGAVTVRFLKR